MINVVSNSEGTKTIEAKNINPTKPIFAIREGKVAGMLVAENKGCILRIGGVLGSSGYYEDISDCIEAGGKHGYTFHQDVEVKEAK